MPTYPFVTPVCTSGQHRQGTLNELVGDDTISNTLGFEPNHADDESKVNFSWTFDCVLEEGGEVHTCGIWDYYERRWSTYGPREVFEALFPGKVE